MKKYIQCDVMSSMCNGVSLCTCDAPTQPHAHTYTHLRTTHKEQETMHKLENVVCHTTYHANITKLLLVF